MDIIELKHIIDSITEKQSTHELESMRVCIPTFKVGNVGGTHCVDVKRIIKGFDWDDGKLLLHPVHTLREIDLDEISELTKKYAELGWKQYEIRNLKKENKKLNEELVSIRKELNILKGDVK